MKFWRRFVIFIIAIISLILGISKYFEINKNFTYSINNRIIQSRNQNSLERYTLENKIVETIKNSKEITDEIMIEYVKSIHDYTHNASELFALYNENYENIYSNNEDFGLVKLILSKEYDSNAIEIINNEHYIFFASHWTINNKTLYLVNGYNIEDLYEEKDRQIKDLTVRDIIILTISSMIIYMSFFFINNRMNKINRRAKQKEDFINGFSHELKTPMTAIMGYSNMLRTKKCDEDVTKKALNYIYTESKRLEMLSHKLLSLMEISDEKIDFNIFEAKSFLEKAITKIVTEGKIEINLEAEEAYVLADSDLLEVVIRNLIENSMKADPKDNKVFVKGEKLSNKKYRISVIDKGIGIPKEHIKRITEDFYMVDKSRSREKGSSGIGLSLVTKILDFHNSKIIIESQENIGTTVYFDLKGAEK